MSVLLQIGEDLYIENPVDPCYYINTAGGEPPGYDYEKGVSNMKKPIAIILSAAMAVSMLMAGAMSSSAAAIIKILG